MAHLWIRNPDNRWAVLPLEGNACSLFPPPPQTVGLQQDNAALEHGVGLFRIPRTIRGRWILLAGRDEKVWLNGSHLPTGTRVLRDRDEIRVQGTESIFFSTESLAKVEPFAAGETPALCTLCKQEIENGDPSVRCPGCGLVYHMKPEVKLDCWTHGNRQQCHTCSHPTDLNGWYRWSPEEL